MTTKGAPSIVHSGKHSFPSGTMKVVSLNLTAKIVRLALV
jgi:hypothetical protein